jgi:hypothetical protein
MKGEKVTNQPYTGTFTGNYEIDHYGCWWEFIQDDDKKNHWMIGEYPNRL